MEGWGWVKIRDYVLSAFGRDPFGEIQQFKAPLPGGDGGGLISGIACSDPLRGSCKAKINPSGFCLFHLQFLQKACSLRNFGKINNPACAGFILALRREGDSNPRYSYPYGSLANCWFKPLTHLSRMNRDKNRKTWINCKIWRYLFQSFKNVGDQFKILQSLLIKILNTDLP